MNLPLACCFYFWPMGQQWWGQATGMFPRNKYTTLGSSNKLVVVRPDFCSRAAHSPNFYSHTPWASCFLSRFPDHRGGMSSSEVGSAVSYTSCSQGSQSHGNPDSCQLHSYAWVPTLCDLPTGHICAPNVPQTGIVLPLLQISASHSLCLTCSPWGWGTAQIHSLHLPPSPSTCLKELCWPLQTIQGIVITHIQRT